MASDLERFRDHCRNMVTAEHRPDCEGAKPKPPRWRMFRDVSAMTLAEAPAPPSCSGCVSPVDREWWARLADEADRYLSADEHEGLFAH